MLVAGTLLIALLGPGMLGSFKIVLEAVLTDGERICTTTVSAVIEGMKVIVREDGS